MMTEKKSKQTFKIQHQIHDFTPHQNDTIDALVFSISNLFIKKTAQGRKTVLEKNLIVWNNLALLLFWPFQVMYIVLIYFALITYSRQVWVSLEEFNSTFNNSWTISSSPPFFKYFSLAFNSDICQSSKEKKGFR